MLYEVVIVPLDENKSEEILSGPWPILIRTTSEWDAVRKVLELYDIKEEIEIYVRAFLATVEIPYPPMVFERNKDDRLAQVSL